jgi:hypothetical protein
MTILKTPYSTTTTNTMAKGNVSVFGMVWQNQRVLVTKKEKYMTLKN